MARTPRERREAARPSDPAGASSGATEVIARLERERDALKMELATAEARIAALESQRTELLNRIDWAIDSLHSLVERQG
jgi:chromosome segregation ATPase